MPEGYLHRRKSTERVEKGELVKSEDGELSEVVTVINSDQRDFLKSIVTHCKLDGTTKSQMTS